MLGTQTRRIRLLMLSTLAGLVLAATPVLAQSAQGAGAVRFDPGQLQSISQLPPGQLRTRLESLPPRAQANALRWLQRISITGSDLAQLRADAGGGMYFADTLRPSTTMASKATIVTDAAPTYTLDDAFKLHSKPGSANKVFLDFDGDTFSNTAWGAGTFVALAFSADADRTTFSATERNKIVEIWHRVAEDLAPFDIDVTTEAPTSFNSRTGHVLITEDQDANGVAMPSAGAGGVAYVNVFGLSNYHTYYSPALVYADNLGPNGETYIAEASSHEFGHNLGLSHDGTIAAGGYYAGLGAGYVSWAPIMGNSYYNNVTEWSKGEYPDANQPQDDLAIIAGKLGYKGDDHGDTIAAGTPLSVAADGTVDSSNPEIDPHNLLPQNKGVINSGADKDVFTFVSGGGPLSLTVSPAWDAFYRTSRRAANLDVSAELRDNANNLVASSDPIDDTGASIAVTVAAGTYHLVITGVGNAVTPYSDYGSLGEFFINGTITTGVADLTAPTPNPMSWASAPAPTSASTIGMTATTAVDAISSVQYRFNCVSGGTGCVASAWQSSPSYVASGLAASTQYGFTVEARDASGNTTAASAVASATTDTPPPPPPYVDYAAASDTPVAGAVNGGFGNTATDNGVVQSITEVDSGGKPSSRYSTLEHRWNFNVVAGVGTTVIANAWSGGSTDGDTFNFQYSLNGGTSWTTMFNVASTSAGNLQSFAIPGAPGGSILVRVVDSNRTAGAREMNTVSVDHLYIQVANPSSDPPAGNPSGLDRHCGFLQPDQPGLDRRRHRRDQLSRRAFGRRRQRLVRGGHAGRQQPVLQQHRPGREHDLLLSGQRLQRERHFGLCQRQRDHAIGSAAAGNQPHGGWFQGEGRIQGGPELDWGDRRGHLPEWRADRVRRRWQHLHRHAWQGHRHLHPQGVRGRWHHHLLEHDHDRVLSRDTAVWIKPPGESRAAFFFRPCGRFPG